MSDPAVPRLAVLTSGGDAQGMNPAVRAVVRTALNRGAEIYAVYEGYQGLVDGGDRIRPVDWDDVSSILQPRRHRHRHRPVAGVPGARRPAAGGAQPARARHRPAGRHRRRRQPHRRGPAAAGVAVAGRRAASTAGEIDQETADAHPALMIAGLVGSIDNDMVGTDMTIGADSALHRIVEAIDAIGSTAASHQRSFVVEVMGRHCGYLALMSAIAGGADYVLIPENPPEPGWEDHMCELLRTGREAGRRNSIVVVAEGAHDREGNPITSDYVRQVLEERLGEDTRVTILGHVQRGGAPSAFDRSMSSILGLQRGRGGAGGDAGQRPAADRHPLQPGVQVAAGGVRRARPARCRSGSPRRTSTARWRCGAAATREMVGIFTRDGAGAAERQAAARAEPDRAWSTSAGWRPG